MRKRFTGTPQIQSFLFTSTTLRETPLRLEAPFLVGPKTLVTNEHVAREGNLVLAVGPVRIPVKIVRVDRDNDLALLTTEIELTSKPLSISANKMSPGESVFAIGNPEGLEKTISDGIVSGVRNVEGRKLLQITSPISHGSSAGPIFNADGEVIGVAVGMLKEGQNLNFAVPSEFVRALINRKAIGDVPALSAADSLNRAHRIEARIREDKYSNDDDSPYQLHVAELRVAVKAALSAAADEASLRDIACMGTDWSDLSDAGIDAARELSRLKPNPENKALLAYVLFSRAESEDLIVTWGKEGTDEVLQASKRRDNYFGQANLTASEVGTHTTSDAIAVEDYVLGEYHAKQSDYLRAIPLHSYAATVQSSICGKDITADSFRSLIRESAEAGHVEDAEKWFRKYASKYSPLAYEWDSEGDRRAQARDYARAADAYERAATEAPTYLGYDYCYASIDHRFQEPPSDDAVLSNGRKCIDASVSSADSRFKASLPMVYDGMAGVLQRRGVYEGALDYIKQAISLEPDNPFALYTEAAILEDLQRPSECVAAAQSAIRVSDGKYPNMQFLLGNCYFDSSDWARAAASFRISAEADRTDAASAFNLALSLSRQGYGSDPQHWFREALNRHPDSELKAKILNALH